MLKEWKEGAFAGYRGDPYRNPYFSTSQDSFREGYIEGVKRRYLDDLAKELQSSIDYARAKA